MTLYIQKVSTSANTALDSSAKSASCMNPQRTAIDAIG